MSKRKLFVQILIVVVCINLTAFTCIASSIENETNESSITTVANEAYQPSESTTQPDVDNETVLSSTTNSTGEDPEDLATSNLSTLIFVIIAIGIVLAQTVALFAFGQPLIAKSGKVKLWTGVVNGPDNSQHIADWYTFSHVIHGFIFYGLAALIVPSWSVKSRFLIALGIEGAWEIIENSPPIIQRYRKTALANGYTGDSILNSFCDTVAMSVGFFMTYYLPVWVIVVLAVAAELIVGYIIRDNLTLNIIQLIHPFECISNWQTRSGNNDEELGGES